MIQKLAYSSGFLAACAKAEILSGKVTEGATMLYSLDERVKATSTTWVYPGAVGPDGTTTPSNSIKWEIKNLSYVDEDTGFSYIEITNTLTAPILSTDDITFHVEFTESTFSGGLIRDAFEC